MSILKQLATRSASTDFSVLKKIGLGTGIAISAGMGFAKGFNSSGVNEAFYEMTTGNPNIDKDVLGTKLSPMEAMLPVPGIGRVARATMKPSPVIGAVGGGTLGGALGGAVGKVAGHGIVGAAIGAGLGAVVGGAAVPLAPAAGAGFVNSKMLGYHFGGARKPFVESGNSYSPNAFPAVDGSIVFGMNNARFG